MEEVRGGGGEGRRGWVEEEVRRRRWLRASGAPECRRQLWARTADSSSPPQGNSKPLFSTHPPSNLNIPNIPSFLGMFGVCSEFQWMKGPPWRGEITKWYETVWGLPYIYLGYFRTGTFRLNYYQNLMYKWQLKYILLKLPFIYLCWQVKYLEVAINKF